MDQSPEKNSFVELIVMANYDIDTLASEIEADRNCTQLLKFFHRWLQEEQQHEPLEAGVLAAGADYFLREFLIGAKRQNIFSAQPEQLKQFGGNWYIISNLEPNLAELKPMLAGASLFYRYCAEKELLAAEIAEQMELVAGQSDYFENRIEDFHQLQDDGYSSWNQGCPFK